jgi:hypothetical protein
VLNLIQIFVLCIDYIKGLHTLQEDVKIKIQNNLTLQKLAIVNGIIFPAVMRKG